MLVQCSIPDCDKPVSSRGWCEMHYCRWRAHGDPLKRKLIRINGTPEQRFWAKVDPCRTDGCAVWIGALESRGYGQLGIDRVLWMAHHFLVGKPPKGLEWDHLCRVRHCVWPDHLELVTRGENIRRGLKGKEMRRLSRQQMSLIA